MPTRETATPYRCLPPPSFSRYYSSPPALALKKPNTISARSASLFKTKSPHFAWPHIYQLLCPLSIAQGYEWVVDIDLEKCFDRINHDILMGRLVRRIPDKRILRLIRRYLQAGVMVNGVIQERYEGTPQGGPLSPLLSNILLDELDQELQRRGHKFCRYADDCNIYVRSERSGKRVMETIEGFLWKRLKLKVNRQKSAVARPQQRQFLGFSFTSNRWLKIKLADKALKKVKHRVKKITRRSRGVGLSQVVKELNTFLRGWLGYFRLIETPTIESGHNN